MFVTLHTYDRFDVVASNKGNFELPIDQVAQYLTFGSYKRYHLLGTRTL